MFSKNTDVIVLNKNSFTSSFTELKNKKKGIIMFGAPWCGHCQRAAPEFEKSASFLKKNYSFYYLNCDTHQDIAKKNGVVGYPTIKFVNASGKIYKDFHGDRSVKSLLDQICLESSICKK